MIDDINTVKACKEHKELEQAKTFERELTLRL